MGRGRGGGLKPELNSSLWRLILGEFAKSTWPHHNKVCCLQLHQLISGPYWQSSSMCAQRKDKAVGRGTTARVTQTPGNATDKALPISSEPEASQPPKTCSRACAKHHPCSPTQSHRWSNQDVVFCYPLKAKEGGRGEGGRRLGGTVVSEAGEIWEGERGQQNDKNIRQPTFKNNNVSHSQTWEPTWVSSLSILELSRFKINRFWDSSPFSSFKCSQNLCSGLPAK